MSWKEHTQSNTKIQKTAKKMKPKPLFFYYVLQSQPSFRFVLFFLGVAYTQLFFELFKFHLEPFKYRHSVNAQPELSFLLRIPLYCCR